MHLLELNREGDELVSRFDGQEMARLPIPADLGPVQLGLEWENAALNLITLEVRGVPSDDWVDEQLR